ncbi:hypothetical protein [Yimella sp. cx-51]|uniref:hypothetical protein n=1 Tax=Yimella sp. cx-51 TaxID=2770551 RepID=UPI00165E3012|nr:hypothetical protein [Yimella sp. cx-51]MBC9957976.1 hypothetical protein [Yimella sp. cx-51]QTH38105.1 hypothetical protein J5M86_14975 [Yimella sp. cx-51]
MAADAFTALLGQAMPTEVAAELTAAFVPLFDGRNENVTDVVERVLGRPTFEAAFARDARAILR